MAPSVTQLPSIVAASSEPDDVKLAILAGHCYVAFVGGTGLLSQLLSSPGQLRNTPLPGMPENIISVAERLMGQMGGTRLYMCANCNEPFMIGNCGMAMQEGRCTRCNGPIGGAQHVLVRVPLSGSYLLLTAWTSIASRARV